LKTKVLIFSDLVLATGLAVVVNIVSSYLQERYKLTDPTRIGLVIAVFVFFLFLLLFITLKRLNTETGELNTGKAEVEIKQQLGDIKKGGAVTGVEAEEINRPTSIRVEQKAEKVSGELTSVRIGTLGGSKNEKGK
jgi:predicted PurR-regulated permease PerM